MSVIVPWLAAAVLVLAVILSALVVQPIQSFFLLPNRVSSTWDPVYPNNAGGTNTNTYTNGNKTAVIIANQFAARGTSKRTTGKWYFELLVTVASTIPELLAGIIPDTATGLIRIYECGDHFSFDLVQGTTLYALSYNGSNLATSVGTGVSNVNAGTYIGFAVDLDTPLVRVNLYGTLYSSPYLPIAGHAYRPGCAVQTSANNPTVVLNTGGSFHYTVPTGYSAWG